jgi:oxalate decarboxylase/phosphoglucose isomerase-like protein (cupin superfamily)
MAEVKISSKDDASWARVPAFVNKGYAYDRWIESLELPIHRGYFVDDLRLVEVKPWEERECNACFIQLMGQEGVSEARVTEIPAGATLPPLKLALDELVYVVDGQGLTTVWSEDGGPKTTFEWDKRSLFMLPRHTTHQFSNARGDRPARMLHYNYLPLAMTIIQEPEFYINNPQGRPRPLDTEAYSEAQSINMGGSTFGKGSASSGVFWYGNFFPDMAAWDKLDTLGSRGAGGSSVVMAFPGSEVSAHMSVFPARTYKKGHRHGPGRVIVIPGGEGFSVMWEEGKEQILIPWHEASMLVPPEKWFHQHFNVGGTPGRYLALHPSRQFAGYGESVEDLARDQIEYPNESPWIRQHFEEELAKRGLTTLMPEEAYKDPNYKWQTA